MIRICHLCLLLFVFCTIAGCGDQGGVVATEDEMKAHVELHGDQGLDPSASTELSD